jgi:HAD superfamily hydrolase (TIGR01509 family)
MDSPLVIRGFLLDMDGLLLDTERISKRCWIAAEEETGFFMPPGFYDSLIGQSMARIRERLMEVMDPACDVDAFLEVASRIYTEAVTGPSLPLKKGARELLELLNAREIPRCLATSTGRDLCGRKLKASGLNGHLPMRVCGDDVSRSKPAPEIYLKAASQLGHAPGDLLVLEDSENGIRSALSAGCKVAHVPDLGQVQVETQIRVDRVFRDLLEVKASIERGEITIG